MKPPLKTLLTLSLIALMVLPMSAIGQKFVPSNYDSVVGRFWWKKWPPWIPGTEGQKEVKVQVLDATTMAPIEGAIVVGGYYSLSGTCVKSESAISDADGWATLPNDEDPRVNGGDRRAVLRGPSLESAYKRGYQMSITIYEVTGGSMEWYVREKKAAPRGTPGEQREIISSRKFSNDHRSALMETKERSRIYLMPSTAKTKEERERELNVLSRGCSFALPFEFSESEGMLAIWKITYQENLDNGFTSLSYDKDMIDRAEKSYLDFRKRNPKE
jgi:hypothetical protein